MAKERFNSNAKHQNAVSHEATQSYHEFIGTWEDIECKPLFHDLTLNNGFWFGQFYKYQWNLGVQ